MTRLFRTTRRGNAILETALVLPILLLLAFGTVEFGHFLYVKHNLTGAAREGVRAGIPAGATTSTITDAVAKAMQTYGLDTSGYAIDISPPDITTANEGDNISVTVRCTWGTMGIRPLRLISADKAVKGMAVMRKEGV